jgi:lipopolysaccharide transport system ATP-binding protein
MTSTKWRKRNRPVGRYVSMLNIPANLLSEGTTYVQARLITVDPNFPKFSERDVLTFLIVDSIDGDSARADWVGPTSGVVRPLLRWNTKFSPNPHKI